MDTGNIFAHTCHKLQRRDCCFSIKIHGWLRRKSAFTKRCKGGRVVHSFPEYAPLAKLVKTPSIDNLQHRKIGGAENIHSYRTCSTIQKILSTIKRSLNPYRNEGHRMNI